MNNSVHLMNRVLQMPFTLIPALHLTQTLVAANVTPVLLYCDQDFLLDTSRFNGLTELIQIVNGAAGLPTTKKRKIR